MCDALARGVPKEFEVIFGHCTAHGARVGDIFMSLIHTCELAGENPFDYLTELQKHAARVVRSLKDWMPWNYRETIANIRASPT